MEMNEDFKLLFERSFNGGKFYFREKEKNCQELNWNRDNALSWMWDFDNFKNDKKERVRKTNSFRFTRFSHTKLNEIKLFSTFAAHKETEAINEPFHLNQNTFLHFILMLMLSLYINVNNVAMKEVLKVQNEILWNSLHSLDIHFTIILYSNTIWKCDWNLSISIN